MGNLQKQSAQFLYKLKLTTNLRELINKVTITEIKYQILNRRCINQAAKDALGSQTTDTKSELG